MKNGSRAICGGAVWGALGVGLGAFGAHSLPDILSDRSEAEIQEALEIWRTAAAYHLHHALALVGWGVYRRMAGAACRLAGGACLAAGSLIFSGSLYALVLTDVKWLGAITPLGGLLMIAGWLIWAWSAWPGPSESAAGAPH